MNKKSELVHVAVGVITNNEGQVLIAKRAKHLHQGGLWEFPGGKVERDEIVQQALLRELKEELNIDASSLSAITQLDHEYTDKHVLLDIWRVGSFIGDPVGMQGQPVQWVSIESLNDFDFPAANQAIINRLRLSDEMMITGQWDNLHDFEDRLVCALKKGVRVVQLRAHHLSSPDFIELFFLASKLCRNFDACLIPNTDIDIFRRLEASALHLTSERLCKMSERPVNQKVLLGASCHNLSEIEQAKRIEVDYLCLSPVFRSQSHPDTKPLGEADFANLVENIEIPVFALGGVTREHKQRLIKAGAAGIAGIGSWWKQE